MTDNTCNGWRNHATWAVGLHLMDTVTDWIVDDLESWGEPGDLEKAGDLFHELLEEQVEQAGLADFPLLCDLLDTDVDWQALGQHAMDAAGVTPKT